MGGFWGPGVSATGNHAGVKCLSYLKSDISVARCIHGWSADPTAELKGLCS